MRNDDDMWWLNTNNLSVVLDYMFDRCASMTEQRRVMREVCGKPWNWTAEFYEAVKSVKAREAKC